jgi:hypothetical protein
MDPLIARTVRAERATEKLLNTFISIPLIGAPAVFNVKDPTHEKTAKSYRPKFLLSYAFVVLRSIVPNSSINEIDALARLYTSYGPAPRTLFQELTGAAEHCQDAGFVAFARKLRNALALDFRLDLELYSLQYLPCMFHRACPALVMARAQKQLNSLGKHVSESRQRTLAYAAMEEQLLQARLSYFRTRGDLWIALAKLDVEHRASIYRITDVAKLCDAKTTASKMRKFIADVGAREKSHASLGWDRTKRLACLVPLSFQSAPSPFNYKLTD